MQTQQLSDMATAIAFLETDISAETADAEARRLNRLMLLRAIYMERRGDEVALDTAIRRRAALVADAVAHGEYNHA